jgi:DNA-binding MarR family transcriptional regulator
MTDERPAAAAAEASRLDLGDLPSLLGFHLRLAHVAMYRDFTEALAGLELTQKQGAVLQLIAANPGVSQADLAATLGSDRATMMALVDRLEERGFVARQRSAQDRRRQELSLTERGRSVLADAMRAIAAHERRFTTRFSPAELKALIEALSRIHQQV